MITLCVAGGSDPTEAAPMPERAGRISNPADLLLRISRTATGLQFTSPQLNGWTATVRGPLPIANALDDAWRLLVTRDDTGHNALEKWDAACEALTVGTLTADDVIVVKPGRRASGARSRPVGTVHGQGQRHDPWAWVQLPDGRWQSPAGHRWSPESRTVRNMLAARARTAAPSRPAEQMLFGETG